MRLEPSAGRGTKRVVLDGASAGRRLASLLRLGASLERAGASLGLNGAVTSSLSIRGLASLGLMTASAERRAAAELLR